MFPPSVFPTPVRPGPWRKPLRGWLAATLLAALTMAGPAAQADPVTPDPGNYWIQSCANSNLVLRDKEDSAKQHSVELAKLNKSDDTEQWILSPGEKEGSVTLTNAKSTLVLAAQGNSITLIAQDKVTSHTTWSFAQLRDNVMALRPNDNWDLNLNVDGSARDGAKVALRGWRNGQTDETWYLVEVEP